MGLSQRYPQPRLDSLPRMLGEPSTRDRPLDNPILGPGSVGHMPLVPRRCSPASTPLHSIDQQQLTHVSPASGRRFGGVGASKLDGTERLFLYGLAYPLSWSSSISGVCQFQLSFPLGKLVDIGTTTSASLVVSSKVPA